MAAGFLLLCFAIVKMEAGFLRGFLILLGALVLGFGILFLIVINSAKKLAQDKNRHNYILYDRKKRREVELDSLSFADIRAKIQQYMAIFKRGKKLYIGDLFDEGLHIPTPIRTLFCYELLYEISESNIAKTRAASFLSFGNECAGVFYSYLSAAGDVQLAEKIRGYFSEAAYGNADESSEKFTKFLCANKAYLESAIMKYTKNHIDEF